MARVHTLADFTKGDKGSEPPSALATRASPSLLPFTSGESPPSSFRLLECLLPNFRIKHCVFIFAVIDLIVYIVTVAYDRSPDNPTSPSLSSLAFFGASIPGLIRKGQIWRLFCPIFLHMSIFHLLVGGDFLECFPNFYPCTYCMINALMQVRIGATIEEKWGCTEKNFSHDDAFACVRDAEYGTRRVCMAYLGCGVFGNLVSAAAFFCNVMKVGSSTAIFGLMGIDLGELLVIWDSIEDRRPVIVQLVVFALLFIFLSLGSGTAQRRMRADVVGHLAGMAAGMTFGLAYNTLNSQSSEHVGIYCRVGYALMAASTGLCIAALWVMPRTCM